MGVVASELALAHVIGALPASLSACPLLDPACMGPPASSALDERPAKSATIAPR
jgi:hypothetical protein